MGRLEEALQFYDETIHDFRNDVYPRSGKAETLRQMGNLEEALVTYEETIRDFKNDVVPRSGKAETLRQMGRLEEALIEYEATIRDFKNTIVPRNGKAETLREMGKLDEAKSMYDKNILDFPGNQFARRALYVLEIQMGGDLNKLAQETIVPNPQTEGDWILNHIHCMLLIKLNKIDEAILNLKKGIEKITNIESLQYYTSALSYAFIKKRKFKDAVAQLKEEIHPQPIFKLLVTHAYAADGNLEKSKIHFDSIIQSPFKKITDTSKYISDRYHISDQHFFNVESNKDLEKKIEDLEFDLLMGSYALVA